MTEQDDRTRFEALAPWHINGTLDESDRKWVEQYARSNAEARAELAWYERLQTQIRANVPDVAPDIGWEKFAPRMRAEQIDAPRSWTDRVRDFVQTTFGGGGQLALRPAFAYAAAAVVVLQAGAIGTLLFQHGRDQAEFDQWRSVQAQGAALTGPVLRVSFKGDTTEQDFRALLVQSGATLVGGPGQLGNYILYVPKERLAAAEELLRNNPHVEAMDELPVLPPKE